MQMDPKLSICDQTPVDSDSADIMMPGIDWFSKGLVND